eukprot:jgi/Hompol1/3100/HPOL_003122-RA
MVVENKSGIDFNSQEMPATLKNLLTIAEDSNAKAVYEATKNLAYFFLKSDNFDIAIGYFRDALATAEDIQTDPALEIEATRNLGLAFEGSGQMHEAIEKFEKSRVLAVERNHADGQLAAHQSLVSAHIVIAEQCENSGKFQEAIDHYTKCLEFLKRGSNDERSISDIEFRLGRVHKETGDINTAIQYLQNFVSKAKNVNDKNKEGAAQAALAACYESSGNPQLAASYLQQFVATAESDPTQRVAESQACNQLGKLYNKMGEFDQAVIYFERHFALMAEITKEEAAAVEQDQTIGTPQANDEIQARPGSTVAGSPFDPAKSHESVPRQQEGGVKRGAQAFKERAGGMAFKQPPIRVGAAQAQLGISRANAQMALYFETIVDPNGMQALLKWKTERTFGNFVPERAL